MSRLGRRAAGALVALVACLGGPPSGWGEEQASAPVLPGNARDKECLICHAGTGDETAPKIDHQAFERSVHARHGCVSCHVDVEDPNIAHEEPDQDLALVDCTSCHVKEELRGRLQAELAALPGEGVDRSLADQVNMVQITDEFERSVHFSKQNQFSCAKCHDPHAIRFGMTRGEQLNHNKVCLRCHASEEEYRAFVDQAPPDLARAHAWLPNRVLHWRTVRCIDCHTSYEAPVGSHLILPKSEALKKCEACHSAQSVLELKMYREQRVEEQKTLGFLNAFIINDAYVIGATRNAALDLVFTSLASMMVLGILGHAGIRLVAHRRRVLRERAAAAQPAPAQAQPGPASEEEEP